MEAGMAVMAEEEGAGIVGEDGHDRLVNTDAIHEMEYGWDDVSRSNLI
jgi:hypothetical protein